MGGEALRVDIERYGEEFHRHVELAFERAELAYNPPPDVVPNSRAALRLTELARAQGTHALTHDRLMRAYWEEALDIGDPEVIARCAVEAGLDATDVDEVLAGDAYRDRVLASTAQAQSIGITGIPAYLLDQRLLVLGAQPREVFERAYADLSG